MVKDPRTSVDGPSVVELLGQLEGAGSALAGAPPYE